MNQRKAGIVISYFWVFVNMVINLFYVPFLLHYMGIEEYGLYRLMGSFIIYFSLIDFGLSRALVRFYAKYKFCGNKKKLENLLALAVGLYIGISFVFLLVGGLIYLNFDRIFIYSLSPYELLEAKKILVVLFLNIFLSFFGQIFDAILTANEKFIFLKSVSLFQILLQFFFVIVFIKISPYAYTLVLLQFIFNILLILLKVMYCFYYLNVKIKYYNLDSDLLYEMGKLASGLFIVSLSDQIYWQSNQVILGIFSNTESVAIYSVGFQIYMNFMMISTVIANVFLPYVTQLVQNNEKNEKLLDLFIRVGRIQFFLLSGALGIFIIFGQELIVLWVGNGFLEAYWIALIVMIPFTIDLIQNIGQIIIQAKNQYGFRARVHFCMAFFAIVLSIPVTIQYGSIGSACVTGLVILVGDGIIMNIYYYKVAGLNILKFWSEIKTILSPFIIYLLVGIYLKYIVHPLSEIALIFCISFCGLLNLIAAWHFSMNDYEKNLMKKLLKFKLN